MKPIHTISIFFLLAIVGCSPKYYVPNTQNVPGINAKGQVNFILAGNSNQTELQAAYGITDKLALQLNGGFVPQQNDNGNSGSGKLIEGGLGYYKNLNESWLFDTYALFGMGDVANDFPSTVSDYPSTTGKLSATLFRYGLQPGLSFHRKYFTITGSARITNLNYMDINGNLIFDGVDQQAYLRSNNSNFLVEPAITIRGGFEKLKLQLQVLRSFNLTSSNFRQDYSLVSVGLNFNFGGVNKSQVVEGK